jgi:hypothetical protein
MRPETLTAACAEVRSTATEALKWIGSDVNARRLSAFKGVLDRELRRAVIQADRLEKAVVRPMCVGVFGPSQAGKSYLISTLARRGTDPLIVDFDGVADGLDFVRQINPEGGEESTGIVTRFSKRRVTAPAGFPVAVRLLTQTDLVKILGNTYFCDCDLSEEAAPETVELDELFEKLRSLASIAPVPGMSEEDVWEIQEYFEQRQFKGEPLLRHLAAGGFWQQASALVSRLPTPARGLLFSTLWGQIAAFSTLWVRLAGDLDALGNPPDAFCTMEALVNTSNGSFSRRLDSIVDVKTLMTLDSPEGDTLDVCSLDGRRARIPRPDLGALVAELHVTMRTQSWDFLNHTDLIDFPGARSRDRIANLRGFLKNKGSLKQLFTRGKVAYLFERYSAEQELTGMLLCLAPGNQEVRTLPGMIKDWIDVTHGDTPTARLANETALFVVLTKFDMEFEQAAGKSEASSERWSTRLKNCVSGYLGLAHDWPREWRPGRPFDNVFWLRNPNYFARHILDYDANNRELGIREIEIARIARMKGEFLDNPDVQTCFRDPGRAWDEALRPNDGGVSYLAEVLAPICNPDIKLRQVVARLNSLRSRLFELLKPFHIPQNSDDRREDRIAAYHNLVSAIDEIDQRGRLGSFIRKLGIEPIILKDALYHARVDAVSSVAESASSAPESGQDTAAAKSGEPYRARSSLREKVLGKATLEPSAFGGSRRDSVLSGRSVDSRYGRAAAAAIGTWTSGLYELLEDRAFMRSIGIEASILSELVQELVASMRRLRLEDKIASQIKTVSFTGDHKDLFTDKATIVSGRIINRFVSSFGASEKSENDKPSLRFDGTVEIIFSKSSPDATPENLPAQPRDFRSQYAIDWVFALEDAMRSNLEGDAIGSLAERAQNEILGGILRSFDQKIVFGA